MRQAFHAVLALFGVVVIAISLAHIAIGPRAIIGAVAMNPTMTGERGPPIRGTAAVLRDRAAVVRTDVERKRVYIDLLAAVFFVGGIGRLLAVALDGAPHPLYVAMLVAELVLPPPMVVVAKRIAESG